MELIDWVFDPPLASSTARSYLLSTMKEAWESIGEDTFSEFPFFSHFSAAQ
jgi:hypothetical protein